MEAPFYAEIHDYAGLRLALRQRVEQLNVSRNCLDSVSGLPSGYVGKILSPYGKKRIGGMSLGLLVRAAGLKMTLIDDPDASDNVSALAMDHLLKAARLKMVLVEDQEALARVQSMYELRQAKQARLGQDGRTRAKGYSKSKPLRVPRLKKPEKPKHEKPYLAAGASEGRP
jgi:hypothetical protein